MYMNSMVRELRKNTKLTDPGKLRNLAEAATEALTVDDGPRHRQEALRPGRASSRRCRPSASR